MFNRQSKGSKGPMHHRKHAHTLSMYHSDKLHTFVFHNSMGFWFQKKKKKEVPEPPVYDDELEDDEEEDVPDAVAVPPPRIQHEEIEMKTLASQSEPVAGPSRLAATNHLEAQSS
ncbi:hypothetical protein EDD22DRAFT_851846 [Suillus occidentalis]|nr:hypothetical protein EDD22DRAFT_851846 [Suillus occidentalis]